MKIFATLTIGLMLAASANAPVKTSRAPKRQFVSNYENVLGTSLELKITATSEKQAEQAEDAALAEIDRLSSIFSSYDQNSEFKKWMNKGITGPVKVSPELFQLLLLFDQWKEKTNGALNPAAAVAINVWKRAESLQHLPSLFDKQNAISESQQIHYKLDSVNSTASRLTLSPLVLNTFAKSYIINKACDAAMANSKASGMVVNIGGDLVVKGDVKDPINITDPMAYAENDKPLARILVANMAIATSGNYQRGMKIEQKWYSHIVDPRTAKPVEGVISATVIAPNATDAGALATAFNVLTIGESKELAAKVAGAEYLIITAKGKRVESPGFRKLVDLNWQPEEVEKPVADNRAEKSWDPKYELTISFQFNAIEGNSHRPFAAIWVEDANKTPVRNLALWYNKTKWLPDLRNWYRVNGEKFKTQKEIYVSATGATRSPGKYTIKWDGKNDAGSYVAQGNYTIIIETAKEHGTDEILRQPMELKKTAKKVTSAGNVEFSNVTFDFAKK